MRENTQRNAHSHHFHYAQRYDGGATPAPIFTGVRLRGKSAAASVQYGTHKTGRGNADRAPPFPSGGSGNSWNHPPTGAICIAPFDVTGLPSALRTRAGRKAPPPALVALCRA